MYGIAGEGESVDNAIATAKMVNQFRTEKFITMNLVIMEGSRLRDMVRIISISLQVEKNVWWKLRHS